MTCSIEDLTSSKCRWPIGDPQDENFAFCGNKSDGDSPYCEFHTQMAYRHNYVSKAQQQKQKLKNVA